MFGQLFGSLCFDFHKPGSATPLQFSYQRVWQGRRSSPWQAHTMRVPSSVQLETRGRCGSQHTGMPTSPWTRFPSSALCLRHRCVRADSPSSSSSQRAPASRPACSPRKLSVDAPDFVVRCFSFKRSEERPASVRTLSSTISSTGRNAPRKT